MRVFPKHMHLAIALLFGCGGLLSGSGLAATYAIEFPANERYVDFDLGVGAARIDSISVAAAGIAVLGDHECFTCGFGLGPGGDWGCVSARYSVPVAISIQMSVMGQSSCYYYPLIFSATQDFAFSSAVFHGENCGQSDILPSGTGRIWLHRGEYLPDGEMCDLSDNDNSLTVHTQGRVEFDANPTIVLHYVAVVPAVGESWSATKAAYR